MADNTRIQDPFAKLAGLATDQKLFAEHTRSGDTAKVDARARKPPTRKATLKVTPRSDNIRAISREVSRDDSREKPRKLPSRDEIQEFTFRLRDELKVKVQAEVPHGWQKELEDIARELDVKKLELYRFILGEFLGKVQRKKST